MTRETFGQYLKSLRLAKGMGLRTFAEKIGIFPSNLSDIENGKKPPPTDPVRLAEIATALGLERDSDEWGELHDLSVSNRPERIAPDLVAYATKNRQAVPFLLRATAKRKLTKDEVLKLIEHIKKYF